MKTKKKKKKRSSSQKFFEIQCESTKITKIRMANTNLGFDLHFSGPEPVNFLGAQSSLGGGAQFPFGGHKQSFGGARPGMPPVAPGLTSSHLVSSYSSFYRLFKCACAKRRQNEYFFQKR